MTIKILLNFLSLKSECSKDKLLSNINRILPSVSFELKKLLFDIEYLFFL